MTKAKIESYTGPKGDILWGIFTSWSDFHCTDVMPEYIPSPQGPITKFLCGYVSEAEAQREYDKRFPSVFEKRRK